MCNNCNKPSCNGCCPPLVQPCYQFPPSPGPTGPTGPTGAQGPPLVLNLSVVNFATNANFPQTPYSVTGSEDVILVDSTVAQPAGTADIYLLSASNPLSQRFTLAIKDAFGQSAVHNIRIIPDGADTIDGVAGNLIISTPFESITLVSNKTTGYNKL